MLEIFTLVFIFCLYAYYFFSSLTNISAMVYVSAKCQLTAGAFMSKAGKDTTI